jgi:uncharacterized membrane protein HdeD (DUF308 family)
MVTGSQLASHSWGVAIIRGVLSIILGLIAFIFPGIALLALIFVFGIYALLDGITALAWSFQEMRSGSLRWIALLLEGLAGIAIGILAFAWPRETAVVLLYLVAIWAVVTGVMEIATALFSRTGEGPEWLLALAGLISVLFGIFLFTRPLLGLLAVLWSLGIYAIIFGVLLIVRAFQFRPHSTAPA